MANKAKVVRLQTHKQKLESIQMEEKKTINDYITEITPLVNQIKSYGKLFWSRMCVINFTFVRLNNIVMAIEESKDLPTLRKEELSSSLKAHEQMLDERNNDKAKVEVALQAQFKEKSKKSKGKWPIKNKGNV